MRLHDIGVELQRELRSRGCPATVIDGPEGTKPTSWKDQRVVIEQDPDASDSFDAPISQHLNPKHRKTHGIACKFTLYAQSHVAGATVFEHRTRALLLTHMVISAMDSVIAERGYRWAPSAGRLVPPEDLKATERPGGVVYELKFTLSIAIPVLTWTGEGEPESTLAAVRSTTRAHRGVDDDNDPNTVPAAAETACGG